MPAAVMPVDAGGTDRLLRALDAALGGRGPAVVLARDAPPPPAGVALVLATSGSTSGAGRPVALSAAALRASGTATHDRLGGAGQWLLALPTEHIAGLQVLVRSVLAGTAPAVLPPGRFDPAALATAISSMRADVPRYLSLVPTQLVRVLGARGAALEALRTCAAVLVGGAATAASVLAHARDEGVRVVTTYGMTETCGGCVYDGAPLDGVRVRLGADGRIHLAGEVLADGYLDGGPSPFVLDGGVRWLRTGDVGAWRGDRLAVLGRADDVLVTGGVNVHPADVERALARVPGVSEVCVVGVPDREWGDLVTAAVVPGAGGAPSLADLRDAVGHGPRAPRAVVVLDGLPLRGPGKVDRRAVREAASAALAAGRGTRL